jgi:hypothetical protein
MAEGPPSPDKPDLPDDTRRELALVWQRIKAWLWLVGALVIAFGIARAIGFV